MTAKPTQPRGAKVAETACHRRRSFAAVAPKPAVRGVMALATLLTVLAVAVAPLAAAHTTLIATNPAEDAVLTTAPARVSATFNEPLQAAFAAMTVVGPEANLWSAGDAKVDGTVLSIAVKPLGPAGRYTVNYRVTSADGHPVTGSWSFGFAPPGRERPSSPAAMAPAPAAAGPSRHTLPSWVVIAGGAVVGSVAALLWARALRRRHPRRG